MFHCGRHAFVQRVEPGTIGDVAFGAVAQARDDREVLILAGLHQPALGIKLQADDSRIVIARARRTLLEPESQQLVRIRAGFEPFATAVGDVAGSGLEQDQALSARERTGLRGAARRS